MQEHTAAQDDSPKLLSKLSQQVEALSDRLGDLEEHVTDLSTDVRLQARARSSAAVVPPLSLHNHTALHDGGSLCVSAAATPRGRCSGRPSSLVGGSSTSHAQHHAPASGAPCPRPAAATAVGHVQPVGPGAESADGVFGLIKTWGDGVMSDNSSSTELKQALQAAAAAAAAAAEAQAAADRCQQQVLELRGRQGQADRKIDTLWQLQETGSSNQAALVQLQAALQQQQQLYAQQQENMAALRAQVLQAQVSSAGSGTACDELRAGLQQLQSRVDGTCRDLVRQADQLADVGEKQQAANATLRCELSAAQKQLQRQLDSHQGRLETCAAAAAGALGKCEDMRQASVVLAGRIDAVAGQIRAAVDPLTNRVSELSTQGAAWSKSAALVKTAVQQEQLAASLAQLSTAAAHKHHVRDQQQAGLAARLEALEKEGTKRDQVVTQEDLHHTLSELRAGTAASLQATVQQLQQQLRTKADEAATAKLTSHLAERFNASETSLLLSIKTLRDKTALVLDCKADAVAVQKWQQEVSDSVAELKAGLSRAAGSGAAQRTQAQPASSAAHGATAAGRPEQQHGKLSPRSGLVYQPNLGKRAAHSPPGRVSATGAAGAGACAAGPAAAALGGSVAAAAAAVSAVAASPVEASAVASGQPEAPSVAQCVAAAEAALASLPCSAASGLSPEAAATAPTAAEPAREAGTEAVAAATAASAATETQPQHEAASEAAAAGASGSCSAAGVAASEAAAAGGDAVSAVAETAGSSVKAAVSAPAGGSKVGGRKTSRSQSQGSAAAAATGAAAAKPMGHAADQQRPFSALQPWSAPRSPPDLHGAATNAKLVVAAQQKAAARQQLAQKKLPAAAPQSVSPQQRLKHSASASTAGSGSPSGGSRPEAAARLSLQAGTSSSCGPPDQPEQFSDHASAAQPEQK